MSNVRPEVATKDGPLMKLSKNITEELDRLFRLQMVANNDKKVNRNIGLLTTLNIMMHGQMELNAVSPKALGFSRDVYNEGIKLLDSVISDNQNLINNLGKGINLNDIDLRQGMSSDHDGLALKPEDSWQLTPRNMQ